jgi:hypothetical protein
MHHSPGTLPVSGGRPPQRGHGAASAKGCTSSGLPATLEMLHLTEAFCAGLRHWPRFAAAAAAPANDGDNEDRGGESQPLLSPPACVVAMTYVCDWVQAIQCTYSNLKPMPCQREGCDALVHHL